MLLGQSNLSIAKTESILIVISCNLQIKDYNNIPKIHPAG